MIELALTIMEKLFSLSWYRKLINNKQEIMIGYSDSSKDAGKLSASWHQYKLQEEVLIIAKKYKIDIFASVFDETLVDFLEELNCPAYKIASLESLHFPLIKSVCKTKKPIIVSTGTLSIKEVDEVIEPFDKKLSAIS